MIKNIIRWEKRVLKVFCGTCLLVALIICLIEIFRRYIMGLSFSWGNESVTYLILIGSFLALGLALESDSHIRVNILDRFIRNKCKDIILITDLVIEIIYITLFIALMAGSVRAYYVSGSTTIGMGVPVWLLFGFLSLGFCLMGLHSINKMYELVRGLIKRQ